MTIADSREGREHTPVGSGEATGTGSLSPSLRVSSVRSAGPAYEIKFLLEEAAAREVEARLASAGLRPDPYSDPAQGGMYRITSLSCDNGAFGVFFRDEGMRNRKYRVRRYGESGVVYLERKRSRQGKVRKRRCEAVIGDLPAVGRGRSDHAAHAWFQREVSALELAPICCVTYLRRALFGDSAEGSVRVTFDRQIEGLLSPEWAIGPMGAGGDSRRLLTGKVVCEFKFHDAMPSVLKGVVAAMRLEPTGVSKYRACVRAFAGELGVDLTREVASTVPSVPGLSRTSGGADA
jgi:hypothetical protein